MSISLRRVMRHPPGTRLALRVSLSEQLITLALPYCGALGQWVETLREAALQVESVGDEECMLRFDSGPHSGSIQINREAEGGLLLRASCGREGEWERRGLVAMLGGKHDVYLGRPAEGGNEALLKLLYETEGLRVSVLLAAFAHRIPPALRGLAPGEIPVGVLIPIA